MPRPVIAFLTDFGTRDHYVAAMKAVALGICPDATLVDITHEIPPQDIAAGALELAAVVPHFPAGTVFVAVVDPGVGSARRAIAAAAGPHRLVAPDNGLLSQVFHQTAPSTVVEIADPRYVRASVSRTFEGRDRFAPAAAWLAAGVEVAALGRQLASWRDLDWPPVIVEPAAVHGAVVRVDRFGNLISNIDRDTVAGAFAVDDHLEVRIATRATTVVGTYAEAPPLGLCALFGSTGHLEIAVNGGSAAAALGVGTGSAVTVARRGAA